MCVREGKRERGSQRSGVREDHSAASCVRESVCVCM